MFAWRVLTIGHLSRNRFWGESEEQAYRKPVATCLLIENDEERIIVDPSLPGEQMVQRLFEARGLLPGDITRVYSTHYHFDHQVCPEIFTNATWHMAGDDLAYMLEHYDEFSATWPAAQRAIVERFTPASGTLLPGIEIVPLPGHTRGTAGLLFDGPEGKILATGDAVMTKEFFRANSSYFFAYNMEDAIQSIQKAAQLAEIIVPGHGEAFLTRAFHG